tara:strand:- start:1615 stop:2205 length:591 start_codon:yes stop_codon:yes gene_type:complete
MLFKQGNGLFSVSPAGGGEGGGGGNLSLIVSGSMAGVSELEFTEGVSVPHLRLEIIGISPDVDSMNMLLLASNNAGVSYLTTSGNYRYQYVLSRGANTSVSYSKVASSNSWVNFSFNGGDTGEGGNLVFDFYNLDSAGLYHWVSYNLMMYETNGQPNQGTGIGVVKANTSIVDAIKLTFSKATSASRYALYEVKAE